MKKIIVAVLLVCTLTGGALAAEPAVAETAPILYPTEVTETMQGDTPRISKVYILTAADDPAAIPIGDFEREGCAYTLLDLTRQDDTATDNKLHTEAVTVESKSNDMEKILPLLPATKDVTTGDGYTGILTLDTASIKVVAAGYGTSSRTVTATRSYPNLSDADLSFVPKTTEDNGRTLELADVQWQEAGGFYHATATYTGTASSKYATGYTVTAAYTGEVSKTTSDTVRYTAIFGGAPVQPVEPEVQTQVAADGSWPRWLLVIPVAGGVGGLAALGVFLSKKAKAKKNWKEFSQ